MEKLTVCEIIKATKGKLLCGDINVEIGNVSINSRDICKNALFVPLHGEKVDSHEFIQSAFTNGAVATLTDEHDFADSEHVYIQVEDTLKALQRLAQYYRKKFSIPVVGVTGSVGKTLTKEMISCVLSYKYNVMKTRENLNGQIGLPLTVFNLCNENEVATVEMGVSQPGEMQALSKIAQPTFAVITNIGVTHIENLKTSENILKEKLHITDYFNENSVLFVNSDNDWLYPLVNDKQFKTVTFGIDRECDFRAKNIKVNGSNTSFNVTFMGHDETVEIPAVGKHNVYNALAAISVGINMGVPFEGIKEAFLHYKTLKMRQCIHTVNLNNVVGCENSGSIKIIDDSYNANPDSMKSAIEVLSSLGENGRKIAVLADMLELGEKSDRLHFEVGECVEYNKIDILFTVGEMARNIAKGVQTRGNNTLVYSFSSNNEVCDELMKIVRNGDFLLFKGSRGMHVEDIVGRFL